MPYEYHRVNTRDRTSRTPEFLAASPEGKVPAIDDDGFRLTESIAINFYLAEKYRPDLMGEGPKERALVHQWSLWAITNLEPELLAVRMHSGLLPENERSEKALATGRANAAPRLSFLDRSLGKNEYLVGNRFSVADVNAASVVYIAKFLGLLGDAQPAAVAWVDRLTTRPALSEGERALTSVTA